MRPAVFLDRDNTIMHNDGDLGDPGAVVLMKGAAPAIASLRGLGFRVVVVTNQGGVARGKYTEQDVHAVHHRIAELVAEQANGAKIDAFYYCPYHPEGSVEKYKREHPSRKPAPGMILQAAEDLDLDLGLSWTVGDQRRDVQAGDAAGTRTIMLHGSGPVPPSGGAGGPDFCASGMVEAVRIIAQQRAPESLDASPRQRKPGEPKHRQWDAQRVAEIQKPREPRPDEDGGGGDRPASGGAPAQSASVPEFRPWSVGQPAQHDKPIATTPFRKRFFRDEEEEAQANAPQPTASIAAPPVPDTAPAQPTPEQAPDPEPEIAAAPTAAVPDSPVSTAIAEPPAPPAIDTPSDPAPKRKREPRPRDETEREPKAKRKADRDKPSTTDKTLRMILQELRSQRGTAGEFSYLTIIAVVLQLVAIVCLLGALWMGGADIALFTRWLGVGLMAQLAVIATLMFGK